MDDYNPLDHIFEANEMRHLRLHDEPDVDEDDAESEVDYLIPEQEELREWRE